MRKGVGSRGSTQGIISWLFTLLSVEHNCMLSWQGKVGGGNYVRKK